MPYRYNTCPHCDKKIRFFIEQKDIDPSVYPAPIYIMHKDEECGKLSTFFVDSLLRVSYKEREKKPDGIATIEAITR